MKKNTNKLVTGISVMLLSTTLLGACDNDKSKTLATTDVSKITQQKVIDEVGIEKVSEIVFRTALNDLLAEKYKDKLKRSDLEKEIDKDILGMGGEKQLALRLAQQGGGSVEDYRATRTSVAYQKYLLRDEIKVSDKDIDTQSRHASHILIPVSENGKDGLSDADAKKKADELLTQVKANPDNFSNVAKAESKDTQSAEKGGDLGTVVRGEMVKSFEDKLFSLNEGQISDVVKTDYGYHIIKLNKSEKLSDKERTEIADRIRQVKVKQNMDIAKKAYIKVLNEGHVKYEQKSVQNYINNTLLKTEK